MEIKDKKGSENLVVDQLLRIELAANVASQIHINYSFPDEQLLALSHAEFTPWFTNFVNCLIARVDLTDLSSQ